jgi:pyruvate,water dikinase
LPALRAHLADSIEHAIRLTELHTLFGPPMWFALHEFENLYCDLFPGSTPLDAHRLLQGFDNKTLEIGRALWQLSRSARGNPSVRAVLRTQLAPVVPLVLEQFGAGRAFWQEVQAFLNVYGHRSDLWDWGYPSWFDDPTPVINNLKNYLEQPDRDFEAERQAAAIEREHCIAAARRELSGYPRPVRDRFEQWLRAAQEALVLTENHTYYLDFNGYGHLHRIIRECGKHFAQQGRLTCADDVFYLEVAELYRLFDEPDLNLRDLAMARRAELNAWTQVAEPLELGTRPAQAVKLYSPDARRIQRYSGAAQIAEEAQAQPETCVLHGQGGSAGKVRGPARVIRTLAEAHRLKTGDILVTGTTAPPWTPLFLTAAALVTDAGGMLSHGAVVAREYHIPAVVGTRCATSVICDGQWLEVDGSNGTVTLL